MLQKLSIKNVALIDSAEIEFNGGLNVLSGETGSGKSVILESLNFVLGAKADKNMIRSGQHECSVKAYFNLDQIDDFEPIFDECDIEYEDTLILSRKFNADGKSQIKLNGNTVTVGMLKKFTSKLVDVHGQSEHFNLLKTSNQLSLIDNIGGIKLQNIKNDIKQTYCKYKDILNKLQELGGDERQRQYKLDLLTFQIDEIENADIKEKEEDELLIIKEKLKNQEKIIGALNTVKSALNDDGGVSDVLSNATRVASGISQLDDKYLNVYNRLMDAYSEVDDISDTFARLIDEFDLSEYNADEIEDRISVIKSIKKKYGNNYHEINTFLINAKAEKELLDNYNENTKQLNEQKSELETILYKKYLLLSDERKVISDKFSKEVLVHLKELGMNKSKFTVVFSDTPEFENCEFNSVNGIDKIEFLFSANLGEPLKPLSMVISGGEMSRFMLAIKANTSLQNTVSTFVFDEIDAGISGVIAQVVAEKFALISKNTQIIAISHLPQISAMADNNLLIKKYEQDGATFTSVKTLSHNEKINEIIRLIGGDENSLTAKSHAEDLINRASQFKQSKI